MPEDARDRPGGRQDGSSQGETRNGPIRYSGFLSVADRRSDTERGGGDRGSGEGRIRTWLSAGARAATPLQFPREKSSLKVSAQSCVETTRAPPRFPNSPSQLPPEHPRPLAILIGAQPPHTSLRPPPPRVSRRCQISQAAGARSRGLVALGGGGAREGLFHGPPDPTAPSDHGQSPGADRLGQRVAPPLGRRIDALGKGTRTPNECVNRNSISSRGRVSPLRAPYITGRYQGSFKDARCPRRPRPTLSPGARGSAGGPKMPGARQLHRGLIKIAGARLFAPLTPSPGGLLRANPPSLQRPPPR
jgi:hypothetical protein